MNGIESLRERRYVALLLLATALAVPATIVVLGFVVVANRAIRLVWHWLPDQLGTEPVPWLALVVPVVGGAIVGTIVRFAPTHAGPDPAEGHGLGESEVDPAHRPSLATVPGAAVTGVASLASGAALGPEAPSLAVVGNGLGWLAHRLGIPPQATRIILLSSLAALVAGLFGSPLAGAILVLEAVPLGGAALTAVVLPSLAASTVGTYLFLWLFDGALARYDLPAVGDVRASHVLWALVIGAVGAAAALGFVATFRAIHAAARPLRSLPILRGALGGLGLGVAAVVFGELVLFSGEHELQEVIESDKGFWALVALVVGKIVASSFSMAAGFRGGRVFPALFVGGVAGLAMAQLFDSLPVAVALACGMTAGGVATMRLPVASILIVALFVDAEAIPLMTLSAVVAYVLVHAAPDFTDHPSPTPVQNGGDAATSGVRPPS